MTARVRAKHGAVYADLERVPDTMVAEIVDGELFASLRPRPRHAVAASALGADRNPPFQQGRGRRSQTSGRSGARRAADPQPPVHPTPPASRLVAAPAPRLKRARRAGCTRSCAIRSPAAIAKGSWPWFTRTTFTSPR